MDKTTAWTLLVPGIRKFIDNLSFSTKITPEDLFTDDEVVSVIMKDKYEWLQEQIAIRAHKKHIEGQ